MKTLTISFYFPDDTYRFRSIKVQADNKIVGRIKYAEQVKIKIPKEVKELDFKIGFYKTSINPKALKDGEFILVYFELEKPIDMYKFNILRAKKFENIESRNSFLNSLYVNLGKSIIIKKANKHILLLGSLISIFLIISILFPFTKSSFENLNFSLAFFIGIGSLISMILLGFKKELRFKDYKMRIIGTILSFILSLFYLESNFTIALIALLTMLLLAKSMNEFKKLEKSFKV